MLWNYGDIEGLVLNSRVWAGVGFSDPRLCIPSSEVGRDGSKNWGRDNNVDENDMGSGYNLVKL